MHSRVCCALVGTLPRLQQRLCQPITQLAACALISLLPHLCPSWATAEVIALTPNDQQNGRRGLSGSEALPGPDLHAHTHTSNSITTNRYFFALNFDLSTVASDIVQAATLQVMQSITDGSSAGTISIYGSEGTGAIADSYFENLPSAGNLISTAALTASQNTGLVSYDLTAAVQNAVDNSWQDLLVTVLFTGGKATFNQFGVQTGFTPTVLEWTGNGSLPDPVLLVSVPEPSTLALALFCVAGLFALALRNSPRPHSGVK